MPTDVPQKRGSQEGYAKRVCFVCSKEGHYTNGCPTKCKMTRSCDLGLYCLKCGKDGHLASWCEKEDDDQPKNQSSNSHTLGQTSLVDSLAKTDDQDTSAK